jgi:hypothetical protein
MQLILHYLTHISSFSGSKFCMITDTEYGDHEIMGSTPENSLLQKCRGRLCT